jgi:hypothetical protein
MVNTETSFQESSNTHAETDVLPVIEERTGELSPERTRQQGPEENRLSQLVSVLKVVCLSLLFPDAGRPL